jgi:hypothetical protein
MGAPNGKSLFVLGCDFHSLFSLGTPSPMPDAAGCEGGLGDAKPEGEIPRYQ